MFWTYLKWLMVLLVWAPLTLGIIREDRHLRSLTGRKPLPLPDVPSLLHTLQLRNIQIFILVTLLLIITAIGDIRYDHSLLETVHTAAAPEPEPVPQQLPLPPATAAAAPSYDKAFAKASTSDLPFSDITEFNEKDSKQQAYIDWLKQHYEAWFVTYYYLQKCGKTGADDVKLIDTSLQKELTTAHADATVRNNILLAATGSYNELYRDIPCDNEHLSATKSTYDANMQQLKGLPTPASKAPAR